jgi:hypothetical protein
MWKGLSQDEIAAMGDAAIGDGHESEPRPMSTGGAGESKKLEVRSWK